MVERAFDKCKMIVRFCLDPYIKGKRIEPPKKYMIKKIFKLKI